MNGEYTAFMVKRLPIFLLILSTPAAFAQLDSNSVAVSATRSLAQQPDQVLFGVTVQSGLNTSLDDVVAALQGSGITAANFSAVSTAPAYVLIGSGGPQPPTVTPMLQWTFVLPAPLARIKDTIATLSGLQQRIAQQNNGLTLSFNVQGTQVSAQLQQSQVCPISDLLADATAQAQKLAGAAGLSPGAILAISSGTSVPGSVGSAVSITGALIFAPPVLPSVCSMTVKFALLRY
jgi:uncharacterized protein YggE